MFAQGENDEATGELARWAVNTVPDALVIYVYGSYGAAGGVWADSDVDMVAIRAAADASTALRHSIVGGKRVALESLPLSLYRSPAIFPPTTETEIFFWCVSHSQIVHGYNETFSRFREAVCQFPPGLESGLRLQWLSQFCRSERNFLKYLSLSSLHDAKAFLCSMSRCLGHLQLARAKTYSGKNWVSRLGQVSPVTAAAVKAGLYANDADEMRAAASELAQCALSLAPQDIAPSLGTLLEQGGDLLMLRGQVKYMDKFDLESLLFRLVQAGIVEFKHDKFYQDRTSARTQPLGG